MELSQYITSVNLSQKTEIEKVKLVASYVTSTSNTAMFSLDEVADILCSAGHPISNMSRLRGYLAKSRDFRMVSKTNKYMLTPAARDKMQTEYGRFFHDEELVVSSSELLDESLFLGKRGFLDKLIKQINHCYSNNCFDACAVLMRRVFEIVLILAYERHGIQDQIRDKSGDYVKLEQIVADAVQNKTLNISRSRRRYDSIRDLGNLAAHKIHFNTRKSDIDEIKQDYRVSLEELYYIAGLKA